MTEIDIKKLGEIRTSASRLATRANDLEYLYIRRKTLEEELQTANDSITDLEGWFEDKKMDGEDARECNNNEE